MAERRREDEPYTAKNPEKGDPERGIPPIVQRPKIDPTANARETAKNPEEGDRDRGIPPLPAGVEPGSTVPTGSATAAAAVEDEPEHQREGRRHSRSD